MNSFDIVSSELMKVKKAAELDLCYPPCIVTLIDLTDTVVSVLYVLLVKH